MRSARFSLKGLGLLLAVVWSLAIADRPVTGQEAEEATEAKETEAMVETLVARLDLEHYKATIKGLTRFGDRRQGTQRNRDAVDWIQQQLEAVGCPTERLDYVFAPAPRAGGRRGSLTAQLNPSEPTATGGRIGRNSTGPGGASLFGYRRRTGVERDPAAQPNERLRALNREGPVDGERQQVFCTKVGATRPDEMYILGAHMDGHGMDI